MFKRNVFIALLVAMLLLVGCTNDSGMRTEQPAPQSKTENTSKGDQDAKDGTDAKKDVKGETVELNVSAAISLSDVLKEVAETYEKDHPNVRITYNLGASGSLQRQIEQDAPVDLFISAGKPQMDALVEQQLIDKAQTATLVHNALVLIQPAEADQELKGMKDLTTDKVTQLAVGEPESVPAGNYSRQALEHFKLWDKLQPKIVFAKDVRQVLTYVETGNVDAGLVYHSDALSTDAVSIVETVDSASHDPIEYPIGIVKKTAHIKEAEQFYNYLLSEKTAPLFEKYGFDPASN
ncbi:molybdate ABC transporter substrate-binding protein [Numidum massiliense]|uniref:molybdate ABC transporter substrate-binding protein n=1 Tax=Numidum massiliense TaxID=1522315 RepID=UPI0006D5B04F|nr:molybdate ABC transporter substrate-binding protein [Numidum massiliense]